jgi:uncharacterized membrane protein YkoI
MNVTQPLVLFAAAAASGILLTVAYAARPNARLPIAKVVEKLEQQGYGPFVEISFEGGSWEVEAYKDEAPRELAVDARTGEVLSEHADEAEPRPPQGAQPLSQILRGLDQAGFRNIDEASFERRYWEIECLQEDGKHEIHVHPMTGEVIHDRRDD